MSRRYFFGLGLGAAVAVQAAGQVSVTAAHQKKVFELQVSDTVAVKIAMTREYAFDADKGLWTAVMEFTGLKADGSRDKIATFVANSVKFPELGDQMAEAWAWDDWREKQKQIRGEE